MSDVSVVVVGYFLLAFKAVPLEGSEVAILSVATIRQLGRNNVLFGVLFGGVASVLIFLGVRRVFLLLPELIIDFVTGAVILYFADRFLRGFRRYQFGKKSFREKMRKMEAEAVGKDLARYPWGKAFRNSLLAFEFAAGTDDHSD